MLPCHFVGVTGIKQQLALRDLPFAVPTVHVDALWHHRLDTDSAHRWLRNTLHGVAMAVFAR